MSAVLQAAVLPANSATAEMEALFRRFPDTPREVIVKIELLSRGHWFTDAALAATRGSLVKSYRLFSYDLVPMNSLKRNEARQVPEWFYIFQGPYDLRAVMIQTTMNPGSPYVVDVVGGRLALTEGGRVICNVSYPIAPAYYNKSFEGGVLYHEVIAFGHFVTAFRQCQYWGPKEECRFCDINENARMMKESKTFTLNAPVKPVDQVEEVGREISREVLAREGHQAGVCFLITGGTITTKLKGMEEDAFYAQYTRALKFGGPRRHVALQTNAKTRDEIRWLHGEGMDEHNANMEVWDRKLFEWINPGKNRRIGYDEWIKRMLDSVDVLGEFNVRPNFVGGIEMARPHGFATIDEALASTTAGMEVMMSHGVDPRFNQWRREPNTNLVKEHEQPPIPTEFYIRLMGNRYDIWKKYGLNLPVASEFIEARCYMGNNHGTYDDYPLLMEAPWYQHPDCRTPEAILQRAAGWKEPRQLSIHAPENVQ
ncbi:MAG: radical SAM protein [Betaproteobacteria bacterium]|nr:radical SAM protein [Betaproteobacteria bacterium]